MQTSGTIRGEAHVVLARPQHLHGTVDRFRHQRRLHRIVVLETPAKASADQSDVDLYLIGIKSDGLRDRVAAVLWYLGRSPQLALRSLIVRRTVARLHRGVCHEG